MFQPGPFAVPWTDVLRLLLVPLFLWAGYRDVQVRRVPNETWVPPTILGVGLLLFDGWQAYTTTTTAWSQFVLPAAISVCLVVPLSYAFWYFGLFGGADAKALMVFAILYPVPPDVLTTGALGLPTTIPPIMAPLGVFSFTILTNAVIVGILYPVGVAGRNLLSGRISRSMFVGHPVDWQTIPRKHGKLLEPTDGGTTRGLDLDALRMYLRWRDLTLAKLRADPLEYRDPETLPADPNEPDDGAIEPTEESLEADSPSVEHEALDEAEFDDPWGAERFLDDIDQGTYGTDPSTLASGLDHLVTTDEVWITPGIPFMVPLSLGLLVAVTYGDVLYGVFGVLGLA